jgi:hypothetical protein
MLTAFDSEVLRRRTIRSPYISNAHTVAGFRGRYEAACHDELPTSRFFKVKS